MVIYIEDFKRRGITLDKAISLVDQAYEEIKEKICNFELQPGQVVSDFTLSKEIGMSRTPIREALQRLERDGLVINAGLGKSYEVSRLTKEEIKELFDARLCIEVMAVRLILEKENTELKIMELDRINHKMEAFNKEGKIYDAFRTDQEFHDYLVYISENKKLMRFHESLLMQLRRIRMLSYLERTHQDKAFREHDRVLDNLKKGNSQEAQKAIAEHIETSKEDYLDLIGDEEKMHDFGVLRFFAKR